MGSKCIGRSSSYFRHGHGRRNAGSKIVHHNAVIENQLTVVHEVMMATGKGGIPLTIRVVIDCFIARSKNNRSCRGIPDCSRILQNFLHACIRCKWFSFLDTDRGKEPNKLRIKCVRRLILNHRVKLFIVVPIVRMNGVELFAGKVKELLFRWIACQRERIAAKSFFKSPDGSLQVAVFHKDAQE